MLKEKSVCIVGLGYVGFPLAEAFSNHINTYGYDINESRIQEINKQKNSKLQVGTDPTIIQKADYVIIAVPTPVTITKEPDLSFIISAAQIVGDNLKKGALVIVESTVYPGATEEVIGPIIEKCSGYKCGQDFFLGYSPERVNPGDNDHTISNITKIVAGADDNITREMRSLYGLITNVFQAKSIKIAESAKVVENIQRDINIALMNELSIIFNLIGIDTYDVLEAAGTKWNFMKLHPGFVGGHCIPIDPYYMVYKAKELGYLPQFILSGRAINDFMPQQVAKLAILGINSVGKVIKNSKVLIMGLTYKENVPDTRESPVFELVHYFKQFQISVIGFDPLLSDEDIRKFGIEPIRHLDQKVDCIVVTVPHDAFKEISYNELSEICNGTTVIVDLKGMYRKDNISGYYKTL